MDSDDENRPEWVKCILSARPYYALCGRYVLTEFAFTDAEHARLNAERGGRLVVCPLCEAASVTPA